MSVLILYHVRSALNVGSIFRTADAVGVSKIYLVGYTPTPVDRFGRLRKDITKTALGAEQSIPWKSVKTITPLLKNLHKEGYNLVALEQSPKSIDYKKYRSQKKVALIVGNEVSGIPKRILDLCNKVIEIPMRGKKESLNVAVATGVVLFRIFDR